MNEIVIQPNLQPDIKQIGPNQVTKNFLYWKEMINKAQFNHIKENLLQESLS